MTFQGNPGKKGRINNNNMRSKRRGKGRGNKKIIDSRKGTEKGNTENVNNNKNV